MAQNKMKTITFFNNKGGVGKTSLAYHVSWMLKELGNTVLSVDLDPQANLTGMFMGESQIEQIMDKKQSLYFALEPLIAGEGDVKSPDIFPIKTSEYNEDKKDDVKPPNIFSVDDRLGLLPGDLKLSSVEDDFSNSWSKCFAKDKRSFRVTTAFSRLVAMAGREISAHWAIIDMGPNLGAINRAILIASDYVVFPLGPDLFSYQGLKNVGKFLNQWRGEWKEIKAKKPEDLDFELPEGSMTPVGYIMMRHSIRQDRPVQAYKQWMNKMPQAYSQYILKKEKLNEKKSYELAHLKDYRSLMPMAQEAHKPMFLLKAGDGAIGSHFRAAQACHDDFKKLTDTIISAIDQSGASH